MQINSEDVEEVNTEVIREATEVRIVVKVIKHVYAASVVKLTDIDIVLHMARHAINVIKDIILKKMCRYKDVSYAEHGNTHGDFSERDEYDFGKGFDYLTVNMNKSCIKNVYFNDDFYVNMTLQNNDVIKFRIDTAAETSVMSRKSYESMNSVVKPRLRKPNIPIRGLVGKPVMPYGCITLNVRCNGRQYSIECQILDNEVPNLLSANDSIRMKLVQRVNMNTNGNIINMYKDVFSGVGKIPGKYALHIDKNQNPVALNARPIPAALREATKEKLDELVRLDIISKIPVGEPTPWCSALHVVPKKKVDGGKLEVRITIDPRDLNKALMRERHPIATFEDVVTRTEGSRYFTVLDVNQGYFQIALEEKSQKLTAFSTPFGRYMYKRLPMGIKSAPEIYQRAMNDLFSDLEGVEIVMDDLLIHGPSLEINKRLEKVLQRCREKILKLNPKKTKICKE